MTELLSGLLRQTVGGFLDVGANLGQTLIKLRALDWNRPYIGLEPNPACVYYLQELVKVNGFGNCTLLPVGLFARDAIQELSFYEDDAADSMASLIADFRSDRRVRSRMYVPVFCFDSIEKALGGLTIGFVKIDVEGAELEVLRTLLPVISRDRPFVSVEILPVYSDERADRKRRQEELELLLSCSDYGLYRVVKSADGAYAGLRSVERIGIHSDLTMCDYLAVPKEREPSLQVLARRDSCT